MIGSDDSFIDNQPVPPVDNNVKMGAKAFDDNNEEEDGVSDGNDDKDPVNQVESLIGKAASIIRKDMNSNGIEDYMDKKKEILGMLTSAIISGADEDDKKAIIDYLSKKINKKEKENKEEND